MRGSDGENYFAGLARVRKNGGQLDVIALRPLVDMEAGIQRQRLVVAALVTVGLVLLGVFSWVFVGRLLRPILENQQRQAQFVASASHELRTPLTAILSAASAMERAEDSQRPVFGQMIRREGQRMGRLIQDMLTLASADSHSWELSLAVRRFRHGTGGGQPAAGIWPDDSPGGPADGAADSGHAHPGQRRQPQLGAELGTGGGGYAASGCV